MHCRARASETRDFRRENERNEGTSDAERGRGAPGGPGVLAHAEPVAQVSRFFRDQCGDGASDDTSATRADAPNCLQLKEKEGWYRYGDSNPGYMAEKRGPKRRR